jgi:hypothetical protein
MQSGKKIQKTSTMKLFNLSFTTVILRFYLMMGIVIGAFFTGYGWLSMLALPLFFFTLLAIEWKPTPAVKKEPQASNRSSQQTLAAH